jgi:pyruvate,water dikinase
MAQMVQTFEELDQDRWPLAGGKGGTLARLYQAGYPVPDGFVILPGAFVGDKLADTAWAQVQGRLEQMRGVENGMASFAVRSSALSEDSAQASFAGEFETVLDVHSDEMIRAAIHTVRQSRGSERVHAYSQAKGMDTTHDMAVVVQRLVRADISGVLFTADPVSGSRLHMTGNYVYGSGDELVSGEAEPYTFTLARPNGDYEGPRDLERFASQLCRLGERLEKDLGSPQDIEWAIAGGRLFLLQSRPITTLVGHNPATGEWNATLTGDYMWTNVMNVEVFPVAATPSTWSVWKVIFNRLSLNEEHPTFGNIAGRFYSNYSLVYALMLKIMRKRERVLDTLASSIGLPPAGADIPPYPVPTVAFLRTMLREIRGELKKRQLKKDHRAFLDGVSARCLAWRQRIGETQDPAVLRSLWYDEIQPLLIDLFTLQDGYNEEFMAHNRDLAKKLGRWLDEDDANAILSTASSGSERLASLGPLIGLARVRDGELTREAYLAHYGHRGPYENYLFFLRPYEDPGWLDARLAELDESPLDVARQLERRGSSLDAMWGRLAPVLGAKREQAVRRQIDAMSETCVAREATRSELTRVISVIRELFLRAGEISGLGDGVFFLSVEELFDVLTGDDRVTENIPARRATYQRYRDLPSLPNWIRGRFDPFLWASDPNRRTDLFDAQSPLAPLDHSRVVGGKPGSSGRAEGVVRRIDSPDQGEQLQAGEILVTSTTNIGWTPLFPRAAAIVTDIGGALSHAAIVARELGIPAVVGCGDATMHLRTGDRVRVDGGRGVVEILDDA